MSGEWNPLDQKFLITGVAGFIGFHLARQLLAMGAHVTGIDNFGRSQKQLKQDRLQILSTSGQFKHHNIDIINGHSLRQVWKDSAPSIVVHLAAEAGARLSNTDPEPYLSTNIRGTSNVLEAASEYNCQNLLIASSSTVYGADRKAPYTETQATPYPVSVYAATKGACELIGHAISHANSLPTTFMRFFTVYGPWGRPDMAYYSFTDKINRDEEIDLYNNGHMIRSFTYIDDAISNIISLISTPPGADAAKESNNGSPVAPYRIVNIGNPTSSKVTDLVSEIETALGKKAHIRQLPMQIGDMHETHASTELLSKLTGTAPSTSLSEGISKFVDWYRSYHATTP
ncbi:MAG: NAD-dependent epimerase/dehydratase family protein [Pseudomonadota bacterium]